MLSAAYSPGAFYFLLIIDGGMKGTWQGSIYCKKLLLNCWWKAGPAVRRRPKKAKEFYSSSVSVAMKGENALIIFIFVQ